jgi:DNA-binding transcriptional MocR family regulator
MSFVYPRKYVAMASSSSESYLYEQIASEIRQQVHQRVLQPGDRLPSVRKMSQLKRVSISTVLQAYMHLEDMGLVDVRPQSGYYVRQQLRNLPPEPTIRPFPLSTPSTPVNVISLVEDVVNAAQYADFAPLGGAVPAPELLPMNKISKIFASLARTEMQEISRYEPSVGNLELRRQIALRAMDWSDVGGRVIVPDDVVISCGATEAINLCLRAVARTGDTIAVESPCYFGILRIIESLGMKALEIPTDPRTGIALDALETAMKEHRIKACILTANFSNPLGSCMPDEQKHRLAALAARYEVPVIEDDIYGDISFNDRRPRPLQSFDKAGWVMLCSSFAKTISPGLRVGFIIPGRFYTPVTQLKIATTLATSTLPQLVLATFLQSGGYEHHLRSLRKSFAMQVQQVTEAVGRYFPQGTKVTRPQGGYLLWVELPETVDAVRLHQDALQHNISIAPGRIFSERPEYRHFIRLSCGYPFSPMLDEALKTLGRLTQQQIELAKVK